MSKPHNKHNQAAKSRKHSDGKPAGSHAKHDASGRPIGMVKQRASLASILAGIVILLVILAALTFLYFLIFR